MIAFIQAHHEVIAVLIIAALDLVFALKSEWKSNGVLHFVYNQLAKLKPAAQVE